MSRATAAPPEAQQLAGVASILCVRTSEYQLVGKAYE